MEQKNRNYNELIASLSDNDLERSVKQLGLSFRAVNILLSNHMRTVYDVIKFGVKNITNLPGVGNKTARDIIWAIERLSSKKNNRKTKISNSKYSNTRGINFDKILLEHLELPLRARNVLTSQKLTTVQDLFDFGLKNIPRIRNAGKKTLLDINNAIEKIDPIKNHIEECYTKKTKTFEEKILGDYEEEL